MRCAVVLAAVVHGSYGHRRRRDRKRTGHIRHRVVALRRFAGGCDGIIAHILTCFAAQAVHRRCAVRGHACYRNRQCRISALVVVVDLLLVVRLDRDRRRCNLQPAIRYAEFNIIIPIFVFKLLRLQAHWVNSNVFAFRSNPSLNQL